MKKFMAFVLVVFVVVGCVQPATAQSASGMTLANPVTDYQYVCLKRDQLQQLMCRHQTGCDPQPVLLIPGFEAFSPDEINIIGWRNQGYYWGKLVEAFNAGNISYDDLVKLVRADLAQRSSERALAPVYFKAAVAFYMANRPVRSAVANQDHNVGVRVVAPSIVELVRNVSRPGAAKTSGSSRTSLVKKTVTPSVTYASATNPYPYKPYVKRTAKNGKAHIGIRVRGAAAQSNSWILLLANLLKG